MWKFLTLTCKSEKAKRNKDDLEHSEEKKVSSSSPPRRIIKKLWKRIKKGKKSKKHKKKKFNRDETDIQNPGGSFEPILDDYSIGGGSKDEDVASKVDAYQQEDDYASLHDSISELGPIHNSRTMSFSPPSFAASSVSISLCDSSSVDFSDSPIKTYSEEKEQEQETTSNVVDTKEPQIVESSDFSASLPSSGTDVSNTLSPQPSGTDLPDAFSEASPSSPTTVSHQQEPETLPSPIPSLQSVSTDSQSSASEVLQDLTPSPSPQSPEIEQHESDSEKPTDTIEETPSSFKELSNTSLQDSQDVPISKLGSDSTTSTSKNPWTTLLKDLPTDPSTNSSARSSSNTLDDNENIPPTNFPLGSRYDTKKSLSDDSSVRASTGAVELKRQSKKTKKKFHSFKVDVSDHQIYVSPTPSKRTQDEEDSEKSSLPRLVLSSFSTPVHSSSSIATSKSPTKPSEDDNDVKPIYMTASEKDISSTPSQPLFLSSEDGVEVLDSSYVETPSGSAIEEAMSNSVDMSGSKNKRRSSYSSENSSDEYEDNSVLLHDSSNENLSSTSKKRRTSNSSTHTKIDPHQTHRYNPWLLYKSPHNITTTDKYEEAWMVVSPSSPYRILGTCPEDVDSHPHVLSPPLAESLRSVLPFGCSEDNFWMKFSLVRDGASYEALLDKVRGSHKTILAIETTSGEVFGSFTSSPWRHQGANFYGSGEAFLWRLKKSRIVPGTPPSFPNNDNDQEEEEAYVWENRRLESEIEVYPFTGMDNYIQLCSHTRLAVGGGEWGAGECPYPNQENGLGLVMDEDMMRGSSQTCATFANPQLYRGNKEGQFEILNVEVWALTPFMSVGDAEAHEKRRLFLEENTLKQ